MVGLTVTAVIAGILPALGAYEYFGLTADMHPSIALEDPAHWVEVINYLRHATFEIPYEGTISGLVTFPSYHTTAAFIYIYCAWRIAILRWLTLAINLCMLVSTPIYGSHYLMDMIGGGLVARAIILALRGVYGLEGSRGADLPSAIKGSRRLGRVFAEQEDPGARVAGPHPREASAAAQ